MIAIVAKKQSTDRRKDRFTPISLDEFRGIGTRLQKASGIMLSLCDEMQREEMTEIKIDGRAALLDAVQQIINAIKDAKTQIEASKMDI